MLEAENLYYAYTPDVPALRGISLTLRAGTILYLLGRNGCGKTTLMNCLSGVLKPKRGAVRLYGRDLHSYTPAERARQVGLIPQLHTPAFNYSVREIVLMGRAPHLGLFASPSRLDYEIADAALESVGLSSYRERPYTQLSGGERQLVLIARGLAQQCRILLMDEPDAHLDLNNQLRVMERVVRLAADGLSFIVTSHLPNNALAYAHEVLLMKRGAMLAYGTPADVLSENLLSAAYDLPIEVIREGERLRAILPRRAS
ncbi:MAG: ABC transporter ATP-binding protein [Anaerolineae bacterium]|nr:ABC transporter ATP-binding protein [Anaerolineae bacterium]